jgi:chromosome segregation ATPase
LRAHIAGLTKELQELQAMNTTLHEKLDQALHKHAQANSSLSERDRALKESADHAARLKQQIAVVEDRCSELDAKLQAQAKEHQATQQQQQAQAHEFLQANSKLKQQLVMTTDALEIAERAVHSLQSKLQAAQEQYDTAERQMQDRLNRAQDDRKVKTPASCMIVQLPSCFACSCCHEI